MKISSLVLILSSLILASCSSMPSREAKPNSSLYTKGSKTASVESFLYIGCDLGRIKENTDWKLWNGIANACIAKSNWFQLGILSERMLETYPDSPWGNYYSSIYAEAKLQERKAYWMIERALNKTPEVGLFTFQKARLTLAAGERFRAIQMFRIALEQDSSLVEAKKYLGLLSFEDEDYDQSLVLLENIPKELKDESVKIALMESYFQKGKNDLALNLVEELSKKSTKNLNFRLRKAQLLERDPEKKKSALQEYINILELSKKSENQQKIVMNIPDKIESLRKEISKIENEAKARVKEEK